MRVAKAWGLTPAQWRQQSVDDRAMMIAFESLEGIVEAYKDEWREKERKSKEDRKDRKPASGGNDYELLQRMRRRMT